MFKICQPIQPRFQTYIFQTFSDYEIQSQSSQQGFETCIYLEFQPFSEYEKQSQPCQPRYGTYTYLNFGASIREIPKSTQSTAF